MVSLLANIYLQETFLDSRTIEKGENGGKGLLCIKPKMLPLNQYYISIIFCLLLNLYDR